MRRILKDGCVIVVLSVVIFMILEMVARFGYFSLKQFSNNSIYEKHPVLLKQEWGRQYLKDLKPYNWLVVFHPYVDFKERPYHSKSINIDNYGIRLTPFNCEKSKALTIYAFGGSTMLGVGVPDNYTIPAFLSKKLNANNICARVVNFGAGWWQSSQSLAQLTELLREGNVPDVVIFYQGINDIAVVTYGGKVGGIAPYAEVLLKKGLQNDAPTIGEFALRNSTLLRFLARRISKNYYIKDAGNVCVIKDSDMADLAKKIVKIYEANAKMVLALGEKFGFKTYFFLQPSPLISKKPLTESEKKIFDARINEKKWEGKLVKAVYDEFKKSKYLSNNPLFFDISDIFDDRIGDLFVDVEHLLPNGNEIVSNAILVNTGLLKKDNLYK